MGLADDWHAAESALPKGWSNAQLELTVANGAYDRAAGLLGPAQPLSAAPGVLRFGVARDGSGAAADAIRRLLGRLDDAGIDGTLRVLTSEAEPVAAAAHETTLAESWEAALETLPADWSDLFGEIELISSDYLDAAALQLAPINPRRVLPGSVYRFRCAAKFGYGASPGMVKRCLERCDEKGIRGSVRVLRALSDTRPVGTQGPVWHLGGRSRLVGDPVSWLMIEPGWTVVDSGGGEVGRIEEVAGDSSIDIFDGLAISRGMLDRPRYVPAEQIVEITDGQVRLSLDAAAVESLTEYREPPPAEEILPDKASVVGRIESKLAPPTGRAGRIPLLRRVLLWLGLAGRR